MRVLIIEDELPAANHLVDLLISKDPAIEITGLIDSNQSLISWWKVNPPPDMIFSDIELLDGPVFKALDKLQISIPIIFTTAYEGFTMEAFESSGIAYLLKPYTAEEVERAIKKYHSFKPITSMSTQAMESFRNLLRHSSQQYRSKLSVKIGAGIYLLSIEDISAIITQNGIPYAYKENGKKLPLSGLVSELESTLNPQSFHRINRSEIINSHFIEKIEPYFNDRLAVKMRGIEQKLIVSGSRTPTFRKWLDQL